MISMVEPVIIVHGGAWSVPDHLVNQNIEGVKAAASIGHTILKNNGSAMDAVEAAINFFENNEVFNAGRGSSLNIHGQVMMDASIQRGSDLKAGCVSLLTNVGNPISLARKVMEETPHIFLAGEGADNFAKQKGVSLLSPKSFVTEEAKKELKSFLNGDISEENGKDTVGAVAIDAKGNLVAGTSTGGTAGKYLGRIGDSPMIGCGTYADDFVGAVSCTGHGESIIKCCLSHTIVKLMESGLSCEKSARIAVEGMTARVHNTGGAICLSKTGDVGFYFTTDRMSWSYIKGSEIHYGIEPNQHLREIINK